MKHAVFEEEYFRQFQYSQRERLIRRYVHQILEWGSEVSRVNILDGRGKTALDVGCAYGYGVSVLESYGYCAVGVDISKHSVRQAKRSYASDFLVCDVQENLPFKHRAFDLVTCFEVLEHLPRPLHVTKNMFDCCKSVLICTTPNRAVEKPVKKLARDYDETHISLKTPGEWNVIIQENLQPSFVKVESFFDASLRVADKLLFFQSFKIPYLGLDTRILIKR